MGLLIDKLFGVLKSELFNCWCLTSLGFVVIFHTVVRPSEVGWFFFLPGARRRPSRLRGVNTLMLYSLRGQDGFSHFAAGRGKSEREELGGEFRFFNYSQK